MIRIEVNISAFGSNDADGDSLGLDGTLRAFPLSVGAEGDVARHTADVVRILRRSLEHESLGARDTDHAELLRIFHIHVVSDGFDTGSARIVNNVPVIAGAGGSLPDDLDLGGGSDEGRLTCGRTNRIEVDLNSLRSFE